MDRTLPRQSDSVTKLVERLATVAREPVTREGKLVVEPSPEWVLIDQSLLLRFHCAEGCTACCQPFSLDFIPSEFKEFYGVPFATTYEKAADIGFFNEKSHVMFSAREVEVNGSTFDVFSYDQSEDTQCPNLLPMADGNLGCGMWPHPPLECATAPNLHMDNDGNGTTTLRKRPFRTGASWTPPAMCEFHPPEEWDPSREIYLLERYLMWADHFGISTVLLDMIETIRDLPDHLRVSNGRPVRIKVH